MNQEETKTSDIPDIVGMKREAELLARELDALQKEMIVSLEAKRIADITEKLKQG